MIRFGTGGWRAVIGDDFIKSNIQKVAQGVCLLAREEGKTDKPIYIGYDRRFLSDTSARWIAEVLCANGLRVLYVGRSTPTPLVMFEVMNRGLHYGIEVTASHNPATYNGIKLITEEGRDASAECTARLEQLIDGVEDVPTLPFDEAVAGGLAEEVHTPFNAFLDSVLSRLDLAVIRRRGLRILFDPMHGSGTYPLTVVLNTARCTVDTIHYNKDAYFGGELPAPGKRQLRVLADEVRAGGYDLGLAFDGDGDRLGVIDRNGAYVDANRILVMLYYYLHEYRGWRGPVVRNNATTHMLDRVAESFGEACYEVPWASSTFRRRSTKPRRGVGRGILGRSDGSGAHSRQGFGLCGFVVCGDDFRDGQVAERAVGRTDREVRGAHDGRGQSFLPSRGQGNGAARADGGAAVARFRARGGGCRLHGRLSDQFRGRRVSDLPFLGHRAALADFCRGLRRGGSAGSDRRDAWLFTPVNL